MNLPIILLGKLLSLISRTLNLGHGSTWPGHIALSLNDSFIENLLQKSKIKTIVVSGTNGKTTTVKLIQHILESNHKTLLINKSGANLLNGIASSLILNTNCFGKIDKQYAVLEVDENSVSLLIEKIKPDFIVTLNLFRDQLDRYGEIDSIIRLWRDAYRKTKNKTTFILNADDPQIATLSHNLNTKTLYFGLDKKLGSKVLQHAADSTFCPNCQTRLEYSTYFYSHLGIWKCNNCGLKRPQTDIDSFAYFPLEGVYNRYNVLASVLLAMQLKITKNDIIKSLKTFTPAFGRQEVLVYDHKQIQILLTKNPTSFNQSLKAINKNSAQNVLLALNDRIPDGQDVSWIWDFDIEDNLNNIRNITISGDRCFDMALRLKYANYNNVKVFENLEKAVKTAVESTKDYETLYILPTYSAMLGVRKILTGKKIL